MALDTQTGIAPYEAPEKDLYEIGEMPPLGYVPKKMYAWAIRRERHGEPDQSFQKEVVDTWQDHWLMMWQFPLDVLTE